MLLYSVSLIKPNFDKKYHGFVTVCDSLKYSYNVPAVKTLNTLTLEKAEKYLTKMNIALEDGEKNLSLALGGMKYGLTIKDFRRRLYLGICYFCLPTIRQCSFRLYSKRNKRQYFLSRCRRCIIITTIK